LSTRDFSKLFFALLALHLAVIYKPESQALYYISKPALLFSLAAFFIHRTQSGTGRNFVAAALISSLAGDILLMDLPWGSSFLGGMAAFAVAHIFFILAYIKLPKNILLFPLALVAVFIAGAFWILLEQVELPLELKPFVVGYAALISFHLIMATAFGSRLKKRAWLPSVGAALFIISDLLLIYNLSNQPAGQKYWQIAVMTFYAGAQYLITIGLKPAFEKG